MAQSPTKKERSHRTLERYQCPPFFSAHITSGEIVEERAVVEDMNLRGLSARTSCDFEVGSRAEIELRSRYVAPVKISALVRWVKPQECEESSYVVGFLIRKVRIMDWFKFMKLVAQVKKEIW